MKLTPTMHEALTSASKQPLRRVLAPGPGKTPWPFHPATLSALVRHELVEVSQIVNRKNIPVTLWSITETGVAVLTAPSLVFVDRPRFLNDRRYAGGDYTTRPSRSIDYDPVSRQHLEAVDAPAHVIRASRVRHEWAKDRRVAARDVTRGLAA